MSCYKGQVAVLMLDQSKITDGFECLMVSIKIGERAIPIAWRIVETEGSIGFPIQEQLLSQVFDTIPSEAQIMLTADRFYGTISIEFFRNSTQ